MKRFYFSAHKGPGFLVWALLLLLLAGTSCTKGSGGGDPQPKPHDTPNFAQILMQGNNWYFSNVQYETTANDTLSFKPLANIAPPTTTTQQYISQSLAPIEMVQVVAYSTVGGVSIGMFMVSPTTQDPSGMQWGIVVDPNNKTSFTLTRGNANPIGPFTVNASNSTSSIMHVQVLFPNGIAVPTTANQTETLYGLRFTLTAGN